MLKLNWFENVSLEFKILTAIICMNLLFFTFIGIFLLEERKNTLSIQRSRFTHEDGIKLETKLCNEIVGLKEDFNFEKRDAINQIRNELMYEIDNLKNLHIKPLKEELNEIGVKYEISTSHRTQTGQTGGLQ